MIGLAAVVSLLILVSGIVFGAKRYMNFDNAVTQQSMNRHYGADQKPIPRPSYTAPIVLLVVGLVLSIIFFFGGAAQVPATHIAVIENTMTGQFYTLDPGTHLWPFSPQLFPLVTKVTLYDLRQQVVEIGAEPAKDNGVEADSSSPGRPQVKFWARGWAQPNPAKIIQLHRRYGINYLDDWVERTWVSSLKNVQRPLPYDYVGRNGLAMQNEVEAALQKELADPTDEQPLVFISQLAIIDYAFDENVTGYLDGVAKKEFERQQSEQQILINTKNQEAQKIQADTDYIVTKRAAEAEQAKLVAEAEGRAEAKRVEAEADAYAVKVKYEAEANGIRQVQQSLSSAPNAFLRYKSYEAWDGKLPVTMLGDAPIPFMDVPMVAEGR